MRLNARLAAFALPALLLACGPDGGAQVAAPAAGFMPVDESFYVQSQRWSDGDEFHYAYKVIPRDDGHALCIGVNVVAGDGFWADMLEEKVLQGTKVLADGRVVLTRLYSRLPLHRTTKAELPPKSACFSLGPGADAPEITFDPPRRLNLRS